MYTQDYTKLIVMLKTPSKKKLGVKKKFPDITEERQAFRNSMGPNKQIF